MLLVLVWGCDLWRTISKTGKYPGAQGIAFGAYSKDASEEFSLFLYDFHILAIPEEHYCTLAFQITTNFLQYSSRWNSTGNSKSKSCCWCFSQKTEQRIESRQLTTKNSHKPPTKRTWNIIKQKTNIKLKRFFLPCGFRSTCPLPFLHSNTRRSADEAGATNLPAWASFRAFGPLGSMGKAKRSVGFQGKKLFFFVFVSLDFQRRTI